MTKVLNLDTFEQPTDKTLILNKKTHVFKPFTVGGFIAQVKEIEAMEQAGGSGMSNVAEFSIKTILRAFPTVTEDELRALTMDQLKVVAEFVRDVSAGEAAPASEIEGSAGNAEGAAAS